MKTTTAALIAATALLIPITTVSAAEDVVIVYDASGSMWGQIDGVSKVEIAREVMGDLVNSWPSGTNLGLVTYGHRTEGNCADIETLIAPAPVNRSSFIETVNAIQPKGKTPLSAAVQHAATALSWRDNPATVVLISDGVETCQADPCALAEELSQQGVKFTAHVVGFDLEDEAHELLACIAENTGGVFVPAQNATELEEALAHVQNVMALQEPPEPEPVEEPLPEVALEAPPQVTTGSSFIVSWSPSIHSQDYVTIVPAGAEDGAVNAYKRAEGQTENSLTAPATPGLYEVRYVLNEGMRTLASAPVEVVEAALDIVAPAEVTTGANFTVSWSASVHPQDYVTIVPAGTEEGTVNAYKRAENQTENSLTAPATPGLYEVRYVLNEGMRTLASAPVEVVEAALDIVAPAEVTTGANFTVSWSASVHPRDYVTIVPTGTEEGTVNAYKRAEGQTENSLTAPATPGLYEVRYVLNEGMRTLASAPVEVVEAALDIVAPAEVTTGANFTVSWSASVHPRDYVTIVPTGTEEGTVNAYKRAEGQTENSLTAPATPGLYEVRYVLNEGMRTLASAPVEVVDADITISGPQVVRAGTTLRASWTAAIHPRDYVTIVPFGAEPGTTTDYIRVENRLQADVNVPAEPGLYEIRYILNEGGRTLASQNLEVVATDAPLDQGTGLSAPAQASAGATITVSWSAGAEESADQRIALARADQADFSWIAAHPVADGNTLELQMPDEAGRYEVRFLDISGRQVLGRTIVEVE